jgi:hypothetical protein
MKMKRPGPVLSFRAAAYSMPLRSPFLFFFLSLSPFQPVVERAPLFATALKLIF